MSAEASLFERNKIFSRNELLTRGGGGDGVRNGQFLRAVVEGSRILNEAARVAEGLPAMLAVLGRRTGLDRVYVLRYDHGAQAGFCEAEWSREGVLAIRDLVGGGPYSFADYREVWEPLMRKQPYAVPLAEKTGATRELNVNTSTQSDLMVPIFVRRAFWGAVGFDDCTIARRYSDAEIQVLSGVAEAIAAALARDLAQADRRASEERHTVLLRAASEVARLLVARVTWTDALPQVLATLHTATGADRVFINRYDAAARAAFFLAEHKRSDLPSMRDYFGPGPWPDDALPDLSGPLNRGLVYRSVSDERNGRKVTKNAQGGVLSDLIVPIMVEGACWGCIGFDDCTTARVWSDADVAVLQTAASAIAAAIARQGAEAMRLLAARREAAPMERHSVLSAAVAKSAEEMLAAERARADEAQTINRLLEGVVGASRSLLEEASFETGLARWLEHLAQAVSADHAVLGDFTQAPAEGTVSPLRAVWARSSRGLPISAIPATQDFVLWRRRLLAGDFIWAHRDELLDPESARCWEACDCFTDLIVPVLVDRRAVGWLSFDWSARKEWNPAFITILRTAADGLASALKRNEAVRVMQAEREARLALERARADENARLTGLLQTVVSSARELLETTDFESGLRRWLGSIGESTQAIRATFYDLAVHSGSGLLSVRALCEWVRAGVGGNHEFSFAEPLTIDPSGAETFIARMTSGQVTIVHTVDCGEPMRSFLADQGNASVVVVPIFMDGRQFGCLSFDHAERCELVPSDVAVLQTAADTLATILKRNEAVRAMVEERERASRERAAELAKANAAMRRTLATLAMSQDTAGFFHIALQEIARLAGACTAHLFSYDASTNRLRQAGAVRDGAFYQEGLPDDPASFREGFDADVTDAFRTMVAHPTEPWSTGSTDHESVWPATRDWHRRMGHRALSGRALMAGERPVGLLGLAFREVKPLSHTDAEVMEALSQQLALAMQLIRLGDQARQQEAKAAVQAERNRLAREIHDTLAQSFTSILLQLEAASLLRDRGDPRADERYRNIRAQAQLGLAETRRTALALSSEALDKGLLPALIQLCQRSHVEDRMNCSVTHEGLPRRLEREREECLLRLAKEALSNAVRHGRASVVKMELVFGPAELRLTIADNGRGFLTQQPREGLGLSHMRSSLARCGGTLDIRSQPSVGTTLVAVLPLQEAA